MTKAMLLSRTPERMRKASPRRRWPPLSPLWPSSRCVAAA